MKVKWSHSALKDFEGCARRYHEVKVLKKYPTPETEQIKYGKELHLAAENYVRDGTPVPEQFAFMTPVLDALMSKPGRKLPEHEMALNENLRPCEFSSPDVWVRGIADLLIIDDDNLTGWVVDYKTGNNKYRNMRILCAVWMGGSAVALIVGVTLRILQGYKWYNFFPILLLDGFNLVMCHRFIFYTK